MPPDAPDEPGEYEYELKLVSDSYVGLDLEALRQRAVEVPLCDGPRRDVHGQRALRQGPVKQAERPLRPAVPPCAPAACRCTRRGGPPVCLRCPHGARTRRTSDLFCDKVTDAGVGELAKHCPQLQSINLEWCDKVTDGGGGGAAHSGRE